MKQYQTTDLSVATTLSLFQPIIEIGNTDPRRVDFIFAHTKELDNLINQYWQGKLKVEPASYFNQLKILKGRIYNQ